MNKVIKNLVEDARYYQILYLSTFLLYGIIALDWDADLPKYAIIFFTCVSTQIIASYFTNKNYGSVKSALITSLGLSLLFKSSSLWVLGLAAFLAIISKFIVKYKNKHFFNPANFGIIVTILLTQKAWISPGQWGSGAILVFLIGSLGTLIVLKVTRIDISLTFLGTLFCLQMYRTIFYLGWDFDVLIHQFSSGSLLLFTFFMITDPVSTPNAPVARIMWAVIIAIISFTLSNYYFVNVAPVWTLFFISPFTPIFDKLFVGKKFEWLPKGV